VGVDALFLEVHDDPDAALCDGPNSYPLDDLPRLVRHVVEIHNRLRDWEASGAGR